ncbi:hypothetical protein BWR18_11105 [Tateyamaria omphalii]|uniref:Guanylate cyclase domain-containing protein n=1 Tax=Tateyamaria omphalii TaxID=299262 RepID=A0A1P8MVQ1_9RHOB|nr:hypothetical protein BWR18_11105 [Tateyamaria omphalii]
MGIGVAPGEVVMGAMGAKDRMDYTALGPAVNVAARLCNKAEPGQVLLDSAMHEASKGLDNVRFETRQAIPLKGYADPVPTFAAIKLRAAAE